MRLATEITLVPERASGMRCHRAACELPPILSPATLRGMTACRMRAVSMNK